MAEQHTFVKEGGHYRVVDSEGRAKSGLIAIRAIAEDKVDELNSCANKMRRVCLAHGCTTEFLSEGPHHRMCNFHRAYSDDCGIPANTGRRVRFRSS